MSVDAKNEVEQKPDLVNLTIDGVQVNVPKGTLIIRAAETIGTNIPRFCDHPLLDPAGACRQCLVEVTDAGNGRGFPKPQPACTMPVAEGMVVKTQVTSPMAEKAQKGQMEFLLINHPLDCPICDKGGECPLQNQAMSHGNEETRYEYAKRTYPKPINISAQILLDRERCILCQRCTRFADQIPGDPMINLAERGAESQIAIDPNEPFESYFSGNVIQICPVGALTSAAYRFQARPFDLVSTTTTCEHCAAGCELRTDHRHHQVKRRLAGENPEVNEEWSCDKGRFGFVYAREDRLKFPLVRENGELRVASWPEAIDAAVEGLQRAAGSVGVQTGGRLTIENAYAYSRFARAVLGTNSIDFRSRPHSAEETGFLAAHVAGRKDQPVTYTDLENAKRVVLVTFEPEDESPIVFLRLRKGMRKNGLKVQTIAPFASKGSQKMKAELIPTKPGDEVAALNGLDVDGDTIILVGERAATIPGLLGAVADKAAAAGARFAWMPRRAGDVGAIDAGCLPNVLPGGRPVEDASARVDVAAAWGVESLPAEPGLTADEQFEALMSGALKALVVAGVELADATDPDLAREALEAAEFVVSIEQRPSDVTDRADVIFPAALVEEQSGHFRNWESRTLEVGLVTTSDSSTMTDLRILAALADALGSELGFRTPAAAWAGFTELQDWEGGRVAPTGAAEAAPAGEGLALASWRELLDASRGNDHEIALRETARDAVVRVSPATAERLGLTEDATVSVDGRELTLPVLVTRDMVDDVVWVPMNSGRGDRLSVAPGTPVTVSAVASNEGVEA